MPRVKIQDTGQIIECKKGECLLEALVSNHIFIEHPCNGKGNCKKCEVSIIEHNKKTKVLSCLIKIDHDMEIALVKKEKKYRIMTKGIASELERDPFLKGYGVAVDLGTTTIVCSLIDLSSGKEIGSSSRINAQRIYGMDVLTRITYEYENPKTGIERIKKTTVDCLNDMLQEVCNNAGILLEEIKEISVAANCTMMHMLLGVDAGSLGKFPYRPQFLKGKKVQALSIGLGKSEDTVLYCLPSVSAFIGADIVAGVYACRLKEQKGNTLFLDIGTNGEMVLFTKGRMYACSCAAGPALEGMNITSGMQAQDGAVEKVRLEKDRIKIKTIGDCQAEGICGSGILSIIGELLRTGFIKKSGVFLKKDGLDPKDYKYHLLRENGKKREFILQEEPEIIVTQQDIRQVQLAKGALLSGFTILLKEAQIKTEDLDKILIAGQFGAHLSRKLLTETGILPKETEKNIIYVGNTSKTGAIMALLSQKAKQEMEDLAWNIDYIELSETSQYERIFAQSLIFPDTK